MSNNSTPALTEEDLASGFFVDDKWYPIGLIWLPSVVLGLPANALVIILGLQAQTLGNFRFAINAITVINLLHLTARAIVLLHYFSHLLLSLKTSVIECSIMGNALDQWAGYYIVYYIPLLALYRYILLCMKHGDIFLSKKRNIWFMIMIAAIIPTVYVMAKLYGMIVLRKIQNDEMCPFKYDDNLCSKWCEPLYQYGVYASYCLSVLLSVLLFIHLYRSFRKVHVNGQRRRLRDEVAILAGIILQILVPLALTVPSKGKSILRAMGINLQVDKDIFQAIYNYNPLCDAIFVFIFVKPYRRAFLRLAHLGVRESTIINLPGFRTNRIAVQVISSGHT
uniref:G-protein coupled receptors family 1 profile domain-containing protein n=1 Tax=Plectus sambesii TaxID=2011161 RepID=A0A914XF08_9BILA